MGLKLNFENVQVGGEAKPNGWYHTKVTDYEVKASKSEKNSGKPMLNFELTIQQGEYQGKKFWVNACLWEGALFTIKAIMMATGDYSEDALNGELEFDSWEELGADIMGSEFWVKNVQREYKGEMTDEIKKFKALDDADSIAGEAQDSLLP